jgi:hypothetical protein
MQAQESVEAFPGFEVLSDMVPRIVSLGTFELKKYLADHRKLGWPVGDANLVSLLEHMGKGLTIVRFATSWSIPEVLGVIGCEKQNSELTIQHLELACTRVDLLVAGVTEIAEIASDREGVDLSFRSPLGDRNGSLRSMGKEPWQTIYLDARSYSGQRAFGDSQAVRMDAALRARLIARSQLAS